jgi:copper chaperone CopZ
MKNFIVIIIAIVSFSLNPNQVTAQSDRDHIEVKVDGLGCPFCAYGLEKKFKEFKGIKDVNIEMETGQFTFTYPSEDGLSLEQIENQVDAAGYTAVKTIITRSTGEIESSEANTTVLNSDSKVISEQIFVAGNCGMCKARIEKAASDIDGVVSADWDKETKLLNVEFDQSQTDVSKIAIEVAKAGHDTKTSKADNETYEGLPGCCHYDRIQ